MLFVRSTFNAPVLQRRRESVEFALVVDDHWKRAAETERKSSRTRWRTRRIRLACVVKYRRTPTILEEVLAIRKVSSACWCATRETSGHASRRIVPSGEGSRRGPLCIPTRHPEHNFSREDFALVMSAPRRNTVSRGTFRRLQVSPKAVRDRNNGTRKGLRPRRNIC